MGQVDNLASAIGDFAAAAQSLLLLPHTSLGLLEELSPDAAQEAAWTWMSRQWLKESIFPASFAQSSSWRDFLPSAQMPASVELKSCMCGHRAGCDIAQGSHQALGAEMGKEGLTWPILSLGASLSHPCALGSSLCPPCSLSCECLHLHCLRHHSNTAVLSTWVLLPGVTTPQGRMTACRDPDGHGPARWGEGGKMLFVQSIPFPITGTGPRATAPAKKAALRGFSPCVLGCGKDWKHACWLKALLWGHVPLQRDKNHLSKGNSVARVRNNNASTLTLSHEASAFRAGWAGRGKEGAWGGGLLWESRGTLCFILLQL